MGGTHLRCVSWTAVSSDPQAEKESLHDQKRLNYQLVDNIGRHYPGYTAEVVADLQVVGSRSIIDVADAAEAYPEAYGRLLDLLRNRQIEAVVCRSRDRLGRVDSLIVTIERLCWKYGAIVIPRQSLPVTLDVAAIRDSEGAGLIAGIEGHIARSAVRRLVNENIMGVKARVNRGMFASQVPYGYKRVYSPEGKQRIEIDPVAGPVIRWILVDLYVGERLGLWGIADRLNERNIPTPRGKTWTESSLNHIVDRVERYAGYVYVNRVSPAGREHVRAKASHAAILTEDEMLAVQKEHARRTRTVVRNRGILAGAVFCADSGKPMYATVFHGYTVYRCNHCGPRGAKHGIMESKLIRAIQKAVDAIAEMSEPSTIFAERHAPEIARLSGKMAELSRSKEAAEKRRQRILRVYIHKDTADFDFDTEMSKVTKEIDDAANAIADARRRISELSDGIAAAERIDHVRQAGPAVMRMIDTDPDTVREFIAGSFRLYVTKEGTGTGTRGKIARIDIL